jgi:hypothetical protein
MNKERVVITNTKLTSCYSTYFHSGFAATLFQSVSALNTISKRSGWKLSFIF